MQIKRWILAVLAGVLVLGGATACGHSDESYRPAAYGENGHCYYVEDPAEVTALYAQGYCPRTWTPVIMPLFWHQMYYPYYSSPAYYNTFVPVVHRTVYVQHSTVFQRTYSSQIKSASAKAVYKNKSGKTTTGNKLSPSKFGGGSRSNGGGGSRKVCGMGPLSGMTVLTKGGGGYSGGSRSSGGGSRSGSSGGSRSGSRTSTSKNKGGC